MGHQLWASPGTGALPLVVAFDVPSLSLVARVDERLGCAIVEFELPQLCDLRPHEDPVLEVWLSRWVDGEADGPLVLDAATLPGLRVLTRERPEVCPLLIAQLGQFEVELAAWLREWPRMEPQPPSLRASSGAAAVPVERRGAPTAADLEFELYVVLALIQRNGICEQTGVNPSDGGPLAALREAGELFCQVALGWIFKLDSVYDLDIDAQPERLATASVASGATLSLTDWDSGDFAELLSCAFFRPQEIRLLRLAWRWSLAQKDREEATPELQTLPLDAVFPRGDSNGALSPEDVTQVIDALAARAPAHGMALLRELLPLARPPSGLRQVWSDPAACVESNQEAASLVEANAETLADTMAASLAPEAACGEAETELGTTPGQAVETTVHAATVFVRGASFERVPRAADCALAAYDEAERLTLKLSDDAAEPSLRCRNTAAEQLFVGASRQMLASKTPMPWTGNGVFRLDLRVLRGTEVDAAHLFEVGLASRPWPGGVRFSTHCAERGTLDVADNGDGAEHFFRFHAATDAILEGVRLVIEVDFGEAQACVRNLPAVIGDEPAPPATPLASWLSARARAAAVALRPPGERDCPLLREHAEYLCDLIREGKLDGPLAEAVLNDEGAQAIVADASTTPSVPLDYHFYVVVPAGMEVEIF